MEAEVAAEFTPLCQVKDLFLSQGDVILGGWAVAGLLLLDVGGTERVAAALLNTPLRHNVVENVYLPTQSVGADTIDALPDIRYFI